MRPPSEPGSPLAGPSAPATLPVVGGRLHPATIVLWPLGQLRSLALLLFAGTRQASVAAALLLAYALTSLVRWSRLRFAVDGDALTISQGLVQRRRRVIPLERIQSVDVVRKLRHRLFGVVEVRVETIGGTDAEGRLDALTPADADRLRAALLPGTGAAPAAADPGEEIVVQSRRDLLVAGLTGGRVGVLAALVGFSDDLLGDRFASVWGRVPGLGAGDVAGLLVVAAIAAFGLSVAATTFAYWDFVLLRAGPVLRVRRGLFEQRQQTIPVRRVQAVRVEENLLRRLLRFASVKVEVAGRAGAEEAQQTSLLLPLGSRTAAFRLVATVLNRPALPALVPAALQQMPLRARTKRRARALLGAAGATGIGVWLFGTPGLFLTLLAVPGWAGANASYRSLGWAQLDGLVIARSGWLVRRTTFVPLDHVQSLALQSSPLQRIRQLATLDIQIARSAGSHDPSLIDLDDAVAAGLLVELGHD